MHYHSLPSVQNELIAGGSGCGRDARKVEAAVGLERRQRDPSRSRGDLLQEFAAPGPRGLGVEQRDGNDRGTDIRIYHQCAAEGLHDQERLHRAAAQTAVRLGDIEAEHAQLRQLPPVRLSLSMIGRVTAKVLKAIAAFQPSAHAVGQHALLVVVFEVHCLEPEHRFGDDVSLHFVGPAINGDLAQIEVERGHAVQVGSAGGRTGKAGFECLADEW